MKKRQNTRVLKTIISQRKEESILARAAKAAGWNVIQSSQALGLTIKIIRDHKIISVQPDKTEEVLRTLEKSSVDTSKLRKGSILAKR
jgi:uncharacterized protein (DUF1778 family)